MINDIYVVSLIYNMAFYKYSFWSDFVQPSRAEHSHKSIFHFIDSYEL